MRTRVCFVCLGNICRSPTAEGIFLDLVRRAGLDSAIEVDSAGTAGWHEGKPADARARATATRRGITLPSRSRPLVAGDLDRFDWVLAMDRQNLADIRALAGGAATHAEIRLFRSFDPEATTDEVPDPYYGGDQGFEDVFDMCTRAAEGLLATIRGASPET